MLAIAVPLTVIEIVLIAQGGTGEFALPMVQIVVIVVGGVLLWHMGGKIVEGMTRIYEEATRFFGGPDNAHGVQIARPATPQQQPTGGTSLFCVHCGSVIPEYATFCRYCGKRQ